MINYDCRQKCLAEKMRFTKAFPALFAQVQWVSLSSVCNRQSCMMLRSVIALIRAADYLRGSNTLFHNIRCILSSEKIKLLRADILSDACKKPFSIYRLFCMPWTYYHCRHGEHPAKPAFPDLSASEKNSAQPSASSQP